jgi:hypothetical protein
MDPNTLSSASAFSSQESSVSRQRSPTAPVQNIHSLSAPTGTGTTQWPANHNATCRAIETLLLARFVNNTEALQQIKTQLMLNEAIEKEKNRLVGSILMQFYKQATTTVTQPQSPAVARPTHYIQPTVPVPSATSLVEHIGSQVRVGHGYVDVTQLAGIDKAEAVKPRTNRGGNIETFPEVSAKKQTCIAITSPTTLTHPNHHHLF